MAWGFSTYIPPGCSQSPAQQVGETSSEVKIPLQANQRPWSGAEQSIRLQLTAGTAPGLGQRYLWQSAEVWQKSEFQASDMNPCT